MTIVSRTANAIGSSCPRGAPGINRKARDELFQFLFVDLGIGASRSTISISPTVLLSLRVQVDVARFAATLPDSTPAAFFIAIAGIRIVIEFVSLRVIAMRRPLAWNTESAVPPLPCRMRSSSAPRRIDATPRERCVRVPSCAHTPPPEDRGQRGTACSAPAARLAQNSRSMMVQRRSTIAPPVASTRA